jgi:septal ring factor EnvC (AmiA/AmiB activator)
MAKRSSGNGSLVLGLVLLIGSASAQTPPSSERARAEAAAQRTADRIKALQRESDALASQERSLLVDLRKLEVERQLKSVELDRAQIELQSTRENLAATITRADSLRKAADSERPDVEARLLRLYKMGRAGYWRLLLDVDDLRSMGRAYRMAAAMTQIDGDRVRQHRQTLDQLGQERLALETRAREVQALQERTARAQKEVARAVAARTALVESIDAQRDLNAQLTGELEAAQQRLHAAIGQLATGRPAAISLPLRPFRGALSWPAQGVVTRSFGKQQGTGFASGLTRTGIEISLAEGQPVRSVHEGVVAFADRFTGYGTLVIIDHGDGAYSLYGHLGSIETSRGARIDAQDRLGTSGRNPAGNPALYFELRVDGKPVDPLQWLKK